jgi:hypothetical protein
MAVILAGAFALSVPATSLAATQSAKAPPHTCGVYYKYTC